MTTRKELALKAIEVGLAVIPCRVEADNKHSAKSPYVSQDKPFKSREPIEGHWYNSRTVEPYVGVVSEACDIPLMFLDIDVKNGKNGYDTLAKAGLVIPVSPVRYSSISGTGEHIWFRAPSESLGKVSSRANFTYNGEKLDGVDNRLGNGYVVVPDNFEVPSREVLESLPFAPDWLWKESIAGEKNDSTRFDGDITDWLKQKASVTNGEMASEVLAIIQSIPYIMDHDQVRNLQCALVKEGAKNTLGAVQGLEILRNAWLRDEYNVPENINDWKAMLEGAIEKYGSPDIDTHTGYFDEKKQFLAYEFAQGLSEDTAIDAAGAFWSYNDGVWVYNPETHIDALSEALRNAKRPQHNSMVSDHLKAVLRKSGQVILDKPDATLINLKNGMYDWKKASLVPHKKNKMSTVQLAFSYDSNALCPKFDEWLAKTLPGNEQLAMEVVGYMLMNGNPKHKAVLLVGSGRNGKSTFLRVLQKMMGAENYSSLTLKALSTERFAPVAMYGKLANIAGDIHEGHLNDSTTFKSVTGLDPISAERKGQQGFTFTPWATLIFSTNSMWSSSDTSDAYLERWLPIPFNQKFTANGQFNEEDLYGETAGIFNKAMTALREMEEQGGKFSSSPEQQDLIAKFRENSDTVLQWLNNTDYLEVADHTNDTVSTKRTEVYESYKHSRRGKFTMSPTELYQDLERKGYRTVTRRGYPHIVGMNCHSVNAFGDLTHYEPSSVVVSNG